MTTTNKINVLVVSPWERDGGLASYSKYLYSEMANACDVSIFPWDYESLIGRGSGLMAFNFHLVKSIRQSDVVHVQYTFGRYLFSIFILLLICKVLNKPLVMTQHERFDNLPFNKIVYFWHQFLYIFIDRIIVHTTYRKSLISKHHQPRVRVIPHGVIKRDEVNKEPKKTTEILIPGIVRQIKGHTRLVESLQHLPDEIELRIAGAATDSEYKTELKKLITELEVEDRVTWEDSFIPEEQMFTAIRDADLIVLPYQEHTSMSGILAHCISWHTPTLVTDCPSFRNVIGVDEAFIPNRSAKQIAKSIRLMENEDNQEKLMTEFKTISKNCSWEMVSQMTINEYLDVVTQ